MQNILILGANGMLGHMVFLYLYEKGYNVYGTCHNDNYGFNCFCDFDAFKDLDKLPKYIKDYNINIIINCTGLLVKESINNPDKAIYLNGYFPHYLESITKNTNIKVIQISTDCIFDGKRGFYSNLDMPNETNWYGKSKAVGELNNNKDLTIRTSIIGPELKKDGTGLWHWLITHPNDIIQGYTNVYWNGLTTLTLAQEIHKIITKKPDLAGIYTIINNQYVSKYEILKDIIDLYKLPNVIVENHEYMSNKVLINTRTREYNYIVPSYHIQYLDLLTWVKEHEGLYEHYKIGV